MGRKLRFRLCPVKSKLKVKKLPMRASLFSIKTLFWTTGNIFSLSFSHWIKKQKKKQKGLTVLTSLPPPSPRDKFKETIHPNLLSGLYVSASGMCCDTCYLWIPACPVTPSPSSHPCLCCFLREGKLIHCSLSVMNVVEIHNQVPVLFNLAPFLLQHLSCITKTQCVAWGWGGLFSQILVLWPS